MPDLTHLAVGDEAILCDQRDEPRPVTIATVGRLYLTAQGTHGQFRRGTGWNKEDYGARRLTTREALSEEAEREQLRITMRSKGLLQTGVPTLTTDQLRCIVEILEES
ncbi:hypothetical protein CP967_31235 [Streptomyces nitrosporeus]|uniref:Uncharacterized protein n=1 Tax=Streptomyces nitrosporeus TaxID=28894 RepID=A0A5J6FIN6_9ACTN|nr:hypothetical protein [Streptomyces nitrosporeus]QEU75846.1 hypothetical protein CP967_31235 [Streptomyces nitrosporeus]GGY88744.1 hypothetical protein GCM10010327_19340 [Streptomyces nitrosporeus]